ncbi:MAG: PH domain-containing protein [Acidimicrobiales bacterium]
MAMQPQAPAFDKQDQYDKIASGLMPGEQIFAVFDCTGAGTGFMGVTNKRLVFQDNAFAGKKVAVTSIPYSRVTSVSVVSDKSFAGKFFSSSSLAVTVSGAKTHEATFRGEDKAAHIHNIILHFICQ